MRVNNYTYKIPAAGYTKNINFKGITTRMSNTMVTTANEFIERFENLAKAKYYEALDDKIYPQNKLIRKQNFSFLENVSIPDLKKVVILWIKELTGFPDLKKTSNKMAAEYYIKALRGAKSLNTEVLAAGFDCTSSVGLQKALPGSDIDKAYVILKDRYCYSSSLVPEFKGYLWENVDQRLVSLNHRDTFPEVYTDKQIKTMLQQIDDVVLEKMDCSKEKAEKYYHNILYETTPVKGGEFNIELAKQLPANGLSKEEVKNFAYFLESVRDGYAVHQDAMYVNGELKDLFDASPFAQFSNVTQMKAHDILLSTGQKKIKTKLQNREKLAEEFDKFDLNKQYRFVLDMIRGISEDQTGEFSKYYKNDDDIKARYDALNRLLV